MKIFNLSVIIFGCVQAENEDDAKEEFTRRIQSGEIDIETPTIESCTELS